MTQDGISLATNNAINRPEPQARDTAGSSPCTQLFSTIHAWLPVTVAAFVGLFVTSQHARAEPPRFAKAEECSSALAQTELIQLAAPGELEDSTKCESAPRPDNDPSSALLDARAFAEAHLSDLDEVQHRAFSEIRNRTRCERYTKDDWNKEIRLQMLRAAGRPSVERCAEYAAYAWRLYIHTPLGAPPKGRRRTSQAELLGFWAREEQIRERITAVLGIGDRAYRKRVNDIIANVSAIEPDIASCLSLCFKAGPEKTQDRISASQPAYALPKEWVLPQQETAEQCHRGDADDEN
jgi:hypothetical protein